MSGGRKRGEQLKKIVQKIRICHPLRQLSLHRKKREVIQSQGLYCLLFSAVVIGCLFDELTEYFITKLLVVLPTLIHKCKCDVV